MGLETEQQQYGWWQANFKINWPENTVPLWHMDLIIAHKIIGPILNNYESKSILFWRFHRRAIRDGAGHVFSFYFYSPRDIADQIFKSLSSSVLLKQMAV